MATGVIHSDGTIRSNGHPKGAPWRCACGNRQVWLFDEEKDTGTVVKEDSAPRCGNAACYETLRPVRRRRPRRKVKEPVLAEGLKPSNPKDAIGSDKIPLTIFPETAVAMGALALLDGACKYGIYNYRAVGIRASIYLDACRRHLAAWQEGEECAEDSGVPHLGHALACIAILIDSQAAGKMTDDRKLRGGYKELVERLTPMVKEIKARHADKSPRHYSIADNEGIK